MSQLMPIVVFLSWLALPVTLVCIVDDWFLRPRRRSPPCRARQLAGAADGAAVPAPPPAPAIRRS